MARPQTATQPQQRSRIDGLADRAPARFRNQAGAAALAVDKLVTAGMRGRNTVRARPVPFALIAVGAAVGVGLLAYGPSRRAIGRTISNTGRGSLHALGRQLGRELRSFIR